jgi:heme-degrading monooxygenase HmoA
VFARLHVLHATPEQSEAGLKIFREQLRPWLRDASGYRGMVRLEDTESDKTLVITFWADEAALEASQEAGEQLAELTAENTGAMRLAVELYKATILDV